jgi:hypothetical protein
MVVTSKIQETLEHSFQDLKVLRALAYNPWNIESTIFGTLGSSGEYGLEFSALSKVIFAVAQALQHNGRFYDFGFGDGLVVFLAAAAGFEALGHEIRPEGVNAAEKSLALPILEHIAPRINLGLGDCLAQPDEFYKGINAWYLYPSKGLTEGVVNLFDRNAPMNSILVMKGNGELKLNLQGIFPHKIIWVDSKYDFCLVSKNLIELPN